VKKKWKIMVWIGPIVLGIPLLFLSTNTDKELIVIEPKSEFILKTEKLIADLSEKKASGYKVQLPIY
jgi:hypothetical protein